MISKEYIAGFFDGEGMVRLNKTNIKERSYYSLQVVIVNTDLEPLIQIQELYGGTIAERIKGKSHHKTSYRWRATANDAERFLREIRPYTIVKNEQMDVALGFQESIRALPKRYGGRYSKTPLSEIKRRDDIFMKLKELKKGTLVC